MEGDSNVTARPTQIDSAPCPRCRCGLFEGKLGEATVLGCGRCGGVWLDNLACGAVVRGTAASYVALAEQASRAAITAVNENPGSCPICAEPLARKQATPAVVIDVCAGHGAWFDPNELRIVALAHARLPPPMTFNRADYPTEAEIMRERLPWWLNPTRDDGSAWNDGFTINVSVESIVSFIDSISDSSSDSDSGSDT